MTEASTQTTCDQLAPMQPLIDEIRAYCERRGMKVTTFGAYAVGDSKFIGRLEGGGQCLPTTVQKIESYMAENPPAPSDNQVAQ